MMQRLREAPALTPSARPVDTYAVPAIAKPTQTEFQKLAESLSNIEPNLHQFIDQRRDIFIEDETKAAQQARLKNQMSYAQAVKRYEETGGQEGIAPGMSPWWVKEYKRMDGQLTARNQYLGWLHESYQQSGLAGQVYESPAESAEAFAQFVDGQRQAFLQQIEDAGDMEWLSGFEQERGSIENMLANANLQERSAANKERFNESIGAFIGAVLDSEGSTAEKVERIATDKAAKLGQFGMSGTDYNRITVDAVINRAVNLARLGRYAESQRELSILEQIPTGTGKLGGTAYAREQSLAAELRILTLQRQEEDYEWSKTTRSWALADRDIQREGLEFQQRQRERTEQAWQDQDNREEILARIMAEIFANPTGDFTEEFADLLTDSSTAPLVRDLEAFKDARVSSKYRAIEDPAELTNLRIDIIEGQAGPEDVQRMVLEKRASMQTATSLLTEWQQAKISAERAAQLPAHIRSSVNSTVSDIEGVIRGSEFTSTEDSRAKAVMAGTRARRMMLEWLNKNPEATELEALEYGDKVKTRILNSDEFTREVFYDNRSQFYEPQFVRPTDRQIQHLRNNPHLYPQFDEKFGTGAAAEYLNKE